MTEKELDAELHQELFGDPNRKLVNLKITRGTAEVITPYELKLELLNSIRRVRLGEIVASGPPVSRQPQVDVRELVAGL